MFCCPSAAEDRDAHTVFRHDLDVTADSWASSATIPPLPESREALAAASCGPHIYICGGYGDRGVLQSVRRVSMCDREDRVWEEMPPMRMRREGAVAQVLKGRIYIIGGHNGAQHLCSVERFDPKGTAWEAVPPMANRRSGAVGGIHGGSIFVCGGADGKGALDTVESFNPGWGSWEARAPMNYERQAAAGAMASGVMYVFGGEGKRQGELGFVAAAGDAAECYYAAEDTWQALPSMFEKRIGASAGYCDSRIYVVGGSSISASDGLSCGEVFDLNSRTWTRLPNMLYPRRFPAVVVVERALYIFGGRSSKDQARIVEVFDVDADGYDDFVDLVDPWTRGAIAPSQCQAEAKPAKIRPMLVDVEPTLKTRQNSEQG